MSTPPAEGPARRRQIGPRPRKRPSSSDTALFSLKVQLRGTRPPVWRRLTLYGDVTLGQLHDVLQVAFGWTGSHLHRFEITGIEYGLPDPDDDVEVRDERRYDLFTLVGEGATFRYIYDFGDEWVHTIKVESVLPLKWPFGEKPPFCQGGRRAGPPEDIGGPHAYTEFVAALPHPDRDVDREARLLELQVGLVHDPVTFDRWEVNRRLRELWAQRQA